MKQFLYKLCIGLFAGLPLSVFAQPVASFTGTPVSGCSPLVVQFTNTSTGATSYNWNLGNTVITSQTNPSTTYTTPGTYTVTLTASNGSQSNTFTATNYITVYPKPFVNFVVSDSGFSCPPKTVQFTNLSIPGGPGPNTYYWDFGNGQTSTLQNPLCTYSTSGNFNVSLIVTNSYGCSQTFVKNNYVHTYNKPDANFTSTTNNSCSVPATVSFTNTTTGATSYLWNFGDGTPNSTQTSPTHTYTTSGTYTVTLVATNANGCKDTLIMPNYVTMGNVDAQYTSPSSVCVNNPITFTNTSTPGPGNSTWYFGDNTSFVGANATKIYTTPGVYNVKLVVTSIGCADSVTHQVTVIPGPTANFTATPLVSCAPMTVQFTNTSIGANTYNWIFGNTLTSTQTNPSTTYTTANTTYVAMLIATSTSGCADTHAAMITTMTAIDTIFAEPDSGCAPFTTTFTLGTNVIASTYNWNFGDGSPNSTQATPTHTYTTPGIYNAVLTYTATNGCTGTASLLVKVGVSPNANFSFTPSVICPNDTVTFTNLSTGPPGTTYTWYFGDGGSSNAVNPKYSYTQAIGMMNVTLIATSSGCNDTMIINNAINVLPPLALFSYNVNCNNKFLVNFTNQSQGNSTNLWDFGDGTPTSTAFSPSHTYANPGAYIIKLKVTNSTTGCMDSVSLQILIYQDIANFTVSDTTICKQESVVLTSLVNQGAIYASFLWNFGDGSPTVTEFLAGPTSPHTYMNSGNFSASLIVTDIYNCKDTLYKTIHVGGPTPNFIGSPLTGCAPMNVNFQDLSVVNGSTITSRYWTFGDGGTLGGNVAAPSHLYVNPGIYSVKLRVTDALGCSDSLLRTNYITANKPHAFFHSPDTITCPGQPVDFVNGSLGNGNLTYAWNFGDGSPTSTQQNPSHIYTTAGNFTVRLIVTDGNGCKDTLILTNYIHSSSIGISFTMSNDFATCPPLAVNFTNTSNGSVSAFSWTFGNGSTSNLNNPSTLYNYPGVYVVTLTGQSTSGCTLTATDTVTVLGPTANITYSAASGCAPLTVTLNSNAQGASSLTWDFNDGVTLVTTSPTVTHTYTQVGSFIPLVILSNGQGCNVTFTGDTIVTSNLDGSFTYAPASACQGASLQFTDTVTGNSSGLTHYWIFGDGGTSTSHNPSHIYATAGSYTVKFIVGNNVGCHDTTTQTIVVNPLPNTNAGPNMAICAGQNTNVQLQATGASTYSWTPATGLSCTNCPNPVASPTVNTSYIVTGTSAQGCQKKDTVVVNVNTAPVVSAGNNVFICQGASTPLAATGGSTYLWTGNNLSCTTCANPTASPTTTTTYSVIGTNVAGCSDTAFVTVNVTPAPNVQVTPNQTICQGASANLQATGATVYSWSPATGLSCTNCASPVATPSATTTYVVTGGTNGCTDTAHVTVTISIPPVSAGPDAAVCDGFSAQLHASGALSYVWAPATGLSCTNCPDPIVNVSTTTTYTVTGTNAFNCTNTDQAVVTIGSIPNVSAGIDQTICEGDALPLQASGANTYVWSPATDLSCINCANPTATPTSTITYQVLGTNTSGCSDSDNVTITVDPAPAVSAGNDQTLCEDIPAQLQASGADSYTWSPGTDLSCTNCDDPIATPASTTTYTVTGTGTNGCTATDDVVVNIVPAPPVDAGNDKTICDGEQLQLMVTGASTYVWTPGTDLTCTTCPDPVTTTGSNITYIVTGTDGNGCIATDSIHITVLQKNPVTVSASDSICIGESTVLNASGGDTYTWWPAEGLDNNQSATPTASPQSTTTYMAIINQQGCFSDTAYVTILVSHPPTVTLGPDQTVLAGTAVQLNAEGTDIYSYAWDKVEYLSCSDCKDPVATPTTPTLFTVTVSNEYGCKSSDDIHISLKCDGSQAFIPNTFTPNNDLSNDKFYMSSKGIRIITRMAVYDRWGELVFTAQNIPPNSPNHGWDGTFKGKTLEPDVFVYVIEAICDLGDILEYKGDISLLR